MIDPEIVQRYLEYTQESRAEVPIMGGVELLRGIAYETEILEDPNPIGDEGEVQWQVDLIIHDAALIAFCKTDTFVNNFNLTLRSPN